MTNHKEMMQNIPTRYVIAAALFPGTSGTFPGILSGQNHLISFLKTANDDKKKATRSSHIYTCGLLYRQKPKRIFSLYFQSS